MQLEILGMELITNITSLNQTILCTCYYKITTHYVCNIG